MSDHEYTESIESPTPIGMTEQDEADLAKLLDEQQEVVFRPVLQVWHEVLKSADNVKAEGITLQWANAIVSKYAGVEFGDMPAYRDAYYELVAELRNILELEIETDDEAFNRFSIEEDREENAHHYLNLLRDWQCALLRRELTWDCTAPTAAVDVAALAEVHQLFFGQQGLTGHLEAIKFEFTESDQEDLGEALRELQENFATVEGR